MWGMNDGMGKGMMDGMGGMNQMNMAFMMGMMDGMGGMPTKGGGKGKGKDMGAMMGMMEGMMSGGMMGGVQVDDEWTILPNGKWVCKTKYDIRAPIGQWQDWSDTGGTKWSGPSTPAWSNEPTVIKITLAADSPIVAQGFPAEAPSLHYIKGDELFSSASSILQEIVGDVSEMIKIEDDPDWTQFPDVAKALKAAGGGDGCIAVGVCPEAAKWAVGVGAGWKGREFAIKLALSVALAGTDEEIVGTLAKKYPGFEKLCAQMHAGTAVGASLAKLGPQIHRAVETPDGYVPFVGPSPGIHLLQMNAAAKLLQEGLPAEGPALVWDKDMKDTFGCAHHLLAELVPDAGKVDFRDDTEWTIIPEIGQAIKQAGVENNCFCLAIAPDKSCWGVGIGNGWKGRQPAAKLALGLSLAMHANRLEELAVKYPEFGAMCAQAGLVENPAKRQRVASLD